MLVGIVKGTEKPTKVIFDHVAFHYGEKLAELNMLDILKNNSGLIVLSEYCKGFDYVWVIDLKKPSDFVDNSIG